MAGKMPDGTKNEVAVSKAVLNSFIAQDYREFSGPTAKLVFKNGEYDYVRFDEWGKLEGKNIKPFAIWNYNNIGILPPSQKIETADDLIGKTVFLGENKYTVTGIIDTGYDNERYSVLYNNEETAENDLMLDLRKSEEEFDKEYNMAFLAFVGEGKINEIKSRYPRISTLKNRKLQYSNEQYDFSFINITPFRDIDIEKAMVVGEQMKAYVPDRLSDYDIIVPLYNEQSSITNNPILYPNGSAPVSELRMELINQKGQSEFSARNCSIVAIMTHYNYDKGYLYPIQDCFVLSDEFFDRLAMGNDGDYARVVTTVPNKSDDIREFMITTSENRYEMKSLGIFQMDSVDSLFSTFMTISRYLGIILCVFAAILLTNFISVSIADKKKQIGIMRALGTSKFDVLKIFFTEGLFVALASSLLSAVLIFTVSIIGNSVLASMLGLVFPIMNFTLRQAVIPVLISVSATLLSSVVTVRKIARLNPIDAIRG